MTKPLVTILIPVYNGEEYLYRLLDSILIQDYSSLQVIIVNDGSADNTEKIIHKYIELFNEKKIQNKYVKQNNCGQSVAIRNGLNYVKGEFLTWPDSDDFYTSGKAISKLVDELISKNQNIVRCKPIFFDGIKTKYHDYKFDSDNIFYDCLYATEKFWFQPICYMINYNKYLELNPNLDFFCEKSAGQNWQFYLILFNSQKCITIEDRLCAIYERDESHSRLRFKKTSKIIDKYSSYINTITSTLNLIDLNENIKKDIIERITVQYYSMMYVEIYLVDKKSAKIFYMENRENISISLLKRFKMSALGVFLKKIKILIFKYMDA